MNLQTNTHTHVSFRMNCVYVFRMLLLVLMQMPTLEWSVCRILLMQVIVLQLITKGQERLSRQQFDINAPANVHTHEPAHIHAHSYKYTSGQASKWYAWRFLRFAIQKYLPICERRIECAMHVAWSLDYSQWNDCISIENRHTQTQKMPFSFIRPNNDRRFSLFSPFSMFNNIVLLSE